MTTDVCALGVGELGDLYRRGELSPREVTSAILERIDRLNPSIGAYISVLAEAALAEAHAAELLLRKGVDLGPLHGIPISVKDNIRATGSITTAASKVLLGAPADEEDSTVVRRLRAAGAILLGKNNLYEFAFGPPGPDSAFPDVENPRRAGRQTGGSSSGSAAAVAAGMGPLSLGTDTGGSVRHPANLCGVVGFTATRGLVPNRGVIPVSKRMDRVGPIARSVTDAAACFAAIAGHDARDRSSSLLPIGDYSASRDHSVAGMRLGIPTNSIFEFGHAAVLDKLGAVHETLAGLGCTRVSVVVPKAESANELADLLMTVDLVAYHERFSARSALYTENFIKRSQPAHETSAVRFAQALELQQDMREQWLALFEGIDVLVLPGNVAGAPRHDQETIVVNGEPHLARTVTSRFTRASSLVGFPTLAVPVSLTPDGLPIGIQLVGPPLSEARLFGVGRALERAIGCLAVQWGIEPRSDGKDA